MPARRPCTERPGPTRLARESLTVGDVAAIGLVSPATVHRWMADGLLKGYRIPGGKHRRVPRGELLRFLREHGMPTFGMEVYEEAASPGQAAEQVTELAPPGAAQGEVQT